MCVTYLCRGAAGEILLRLGRTHSEKRRSAHPASGDIVGQFAVELKSGAVPPTELSRLFLLRDAL